MNEILPAGDALTPSDGISADSPPVAPLRPDDADRTSKPRWRARRAPRKRGALSFVSRLAGLVMGLIAVGATIGLGAAYTGYQHYSADLPSVDGLRNYQPRVMSRVYSSDARLIAELATERRVFIPYPAIPDVVKQAFVAAEDQNFWIHRGVDPLAMARAALTNLSQYGQGRRPIGASTITQQVAKNMLLDSQLSLSRKVKEVILALRIEESLTKERILELYLNEIYLGLQSYGVAAAAQAYFEKPLEELTIAEAAFLAALPKAPNNYNPYRFPDAARARRDWVIDRMAETHAITVEQAQAAKAQPLMPVKFRKPQVVSGADWFAEEVRRKLVERFGADSTTQGGLVVRTTMDPGLQAAADRALRDGLMAYDRKNGGWRGPVGHMEGSGSNLRATWADRIAQVKVPGLRASWRLAVVLETSENEAKVGWLEKRDPTVPGQPRAGVVELASFGWGRMVRDGRMTGPPRRMTDVMKTGDLVMIQPPSSGSGSSPAAATEDSPEGATVQTDSGKTGAQRNVRAERGERAERVQLRQTPGVQGALVSLDPRTGRVLAMVGGWSFDQSQFNRATQAQRQPGSSFKPMVYLTALEKGVSPSQRFLDAPITAEQSGLGEWHPNNFGGKFSNAPVPMRIALEKSLNLVTVRIAQQVGMEAVAQTAIAFHVVDTMPRVLPASLGAVDTTVLRQAGAYASLAENGREVTPTLIDSVQDRDGHVVWRAPGLTCDACGDPGHPPETTDDRRQIADAPSVFQVVTMMQGVVQRGTGAAAGKGLGREIAGKTGTSQDYNDAWFVGFTPDLVTAVWIGYDIPASLGNNETGGVIAAPIWHQFMAAALKDRPVLTFKAPPGVTLAKWDSGSGEVTDAFKPGQTPGASGPVEGVPVAEAPAARAPVHVTPASGIDSGMGGLY